MKHFKFRKFFCALLMFILLITNVLSAEAASYCGINSFVVNWTEKSGFLKLNTDKYSCTATYSSSCIVLLNNLSGTKYWGNYQNKAETAQSMEVGISKSITCSKTTAWDITGGIGLKKTVKAVEVSGQIGGSYSKSTTYSKTVGTSSAYTINTLSKNGYYAVTNANNLDVYSATVKKNGSFYGSGFIARYQSTTPYERLWYSTNPF